MRRRFSFPYFALLFPLFFVLHGFTENFFFVNVSTALILAGIYLLAAIILTALFYLLSRQLILSAIMSCMLLFIPFFFCHNPHFSKDNFNFISKYSILLPLFLLILVIIYILLRKRH